MTSTTWAELKQADWIICPGDGRPEQVTFNRVGASRPNARPRRAVRTSRHDHNRPADDMVQRTKDPRPGWKADWKDRS